jgi:hypothetical protein
VGIQYEAKTGTMNLLSAVVMTVNRPQPVHLNADHGVITKQPHQVVLTTVHMTREQQEAWSDQATFFLREDNTVDRILAEGDVRDRDSWQARNARAFRPRRIVADRHAESTHHGHSHGQRATPPRERSPPTLPLGGPRCTLPGSKC